MSKFILKKVEDFKRWDEFVDRSPQGTIFFSSEYVQLVEGPYELLYVLKGEEWKAGLSLMLSDDRSRCVIDDLVIYNGILFNRDLTQKPVKSRMERFEITEFIIEELDKRYLSVEIALASQFEDVRPFLWHNYSSASPETTYKTDLRYTSYLDISELANNENEEDTKLFRNLDTLRQRNIREGRKKGAEVVEGGDIRILLDFYSENLKTQSKSIDAKKLRRMGNLVESLLNSGAAFIYSSKNSDGEVVYITVFCQDNKRAYFLFGAGHPQLADRYLGTLAFWDAFKDLARNRAVKQVDLEGVNSPDRGRFKLSFGGDLRSYFKVFKPHSQFDMHR